MPRDPVRYRDPELVALILGTVYDDEEGTVRWLDLLDAASSPRFPWKTVENVVYDLIAYGALHRIGKPGNSRTPDTRALRPTALGRAWLEREILPLPRKDPEQ